MNPNHDMNTIITLTIRLSSLYQKKESIHLLIANKGGTSWPLSLFQSNQSILGTVDSKHTVQLLYNFLKYNSW